MINGVADHTLKDRETTSAGMGFSEEAISDGTHESVFTEDVEGTESPRKALEPQKSELVNVALTAPETETASAKREKLDGEFLEIPLTKVINFPPSGLDQEDVGLLSGVAITKVTTPEEETTDAIEEMALKALENQRAQALNEEMMLSNQLVENPLVITDGSWERTAGGRGGTVFEDFPEGAVRLSSIKIWSGWWVDSIQMVWKLKDGSTQVSTRRGGTGGSLETFVLDADEYLTAITGKYGKYVGSITFHTNKRKSPTYGLGKGAGAGKDFEINVPEGKAIVGLHGRSANYLDAIGAVVRSNKESPYTYTSDGFYLVE